MLYEATTFYAMLTNKAASRNHHKLSNDMILRSILLPGNSRCDQTRRIGDRPEDLGASFSAKTIVQSERRQVDRAAISPKFAFGTHM